MTQTSPARRPPSGERTAMLVAAAVGVIALISVLAVALFSSDKASGHSLSLPGNPGPGNSGNPGGPTGGQLHVGGGTEPPGVSTSGPSVRAVSYEYLLAHFPLPADAKFVSKDSTWVTHLSHQSVQSLRAFYRRELPKLGVTWRTLKPTLENGRPVVLFGELSGGTNGQPYGTLTLTLNANGATPGQVTILEGLQTDR